MSSSAKGLEEDGPFHKLLGRVQGDPRDDCHAYETMRGREGRWYQRGQARGKHMTMEKGTEASVVVNC